MSSLLAGVCVLALLAALSLPLLGCDAPGRQEKTRIRFWNGFTGPDGTTMLAIVKQFKRDNPDVDVVMQRLDWATYYNKLFVAALGHRSPEVFILHTSSLERFVAAGLTRPIDDLLESPGGLPVDDFYENVWAEVQRDGRTVGVPLDVHMLGMFLNLDMIREAGFVDADGRPTAPATREEFMTLMETITNSEDPAARQSWGMVFTWYRTNMLSFMWQWGGRMFTPDLSRCTLNSPENVAALQFCVDLISKYRHAPAPEAFDAWIGFRQGRVAIALEGIYMLEDVRKQVDLNYAGAPLVTLGQQPATWADSHTMCFSRDLEGDELEAAWRLVRYLSDHSLDWAQGGQVPVRRSLQESPRFQEMKVQAQFARQIPYLHYLPRIRFTSEFLSEFDRAVEFALRGTKTPQAALDEATLRVNQVLERHRRMGWFDDEATTTTEAD